MDPKARRKHVMARSIKLGHCVCDPRKPCPCPLYKEKNVCTCAGERVPAEFAGRPVRLTEWVRSAGCASKIGQKDLHEVLGMLPPITDPRLLVGTATADDAGVFRLARGVTIVQTVDVFTPGVDDPYLFGQIAACNSLSDVYAMGGTPVTALSVIGFPIHSLPHSVMAGIIRGGLDTLAEAETVLLGGHSINDEEIKFGFAVTGVIDEKDLVTNAGAGAGDVLILTKPLGTGIISLARQIGRASDESIAAAEKAMSSLNRDASRIMVKNGATACTDVTGFGLLGHLCRLAIESRITAEIWTDRLPLLPGVLDCASKGIFSGAHERNAEYTSEYTVMDDAVGDAVKAVLLDAQTSGGLLIAVAEAGAEAMKAELDAAGVSAAVIGRVTEKSDGRILVRRSEQDHRKSITVDGGTERRPSAQGKEETRMRESASESPEASCCEHGSGSADGATRKFEAFMASALSPGAIDVVTKELMAVALGLAVHCVPCSRIHIKKALSMGIGPAELEEAAALAIGFAGCRALMLWNELKKELPKGA